MHQVKSLYTRNGSIVEDQSNSLGEQKIKKTHLLKINSLLAPLRI